MPPVLLLIGIGYGPWIPLPLVLLWPFIALTWMVLTFCQPLVPKDRGARHWIAFARHALTVFRRLSGLRLDVRTKGGGGVNIWIL